MRWMAEWVWVSVDVKPNAGFHSTHSILSFPRTNPHNAVGDFAYDMDERDGKQGDLFMREIEPIAARVPYMVDVGNHENAYQFSHYTERFRNMPISDWTAPIWTYNGPAPNNWSVLGLLGWHDMHR